MKRSPQAADRVSATSPATASSSVRRCRRRFSSLQRTLCLEQLEDRRLLHHGPSGGFGIVGDSLSDEYAHETYSYARNWVELLAEESHFDLGRSEINWGEPRRNGEYEYNWARSGATSDSLLKSGQHTGLAKQIENRDVRHAVLAIGQNDFHPDPDGYADGDPVAYDSIYHGTWSSQEIDSYVNTTATNIQTAATTLLSEGVNLVISNIADYGFSPIVRQYYTSATMRERVTTVINQVNQQIDSLAQQQHVTVVDLAGFAAAVFGTNSQTISSQQIGGVVITNDSGTQATHAFVNDGIHPHTVTQAALANLFVEGMNHGYGLELDTFSEQEMVEAAGLTYGGTDTWNFNYANYVDVYSLNDAPTWMVPGAQQINKNGSLAIPSLTAVDVDAGAGAVSISLAVAHGSLTLDQTTGLAFTSGDGTSDSLLTFSGTLTDVNAALSGLTYQPQHDFHGADTLQLAVNDQGNTGIGGAKTAATTVNITVHNTNSAPIAVADTFVVPPAGTLQVTVPGILSNDTDADGHALTPSVVSGPFKGTLDLSSNGAFTYTRNPGGTLNGTPGAEVDLDQQDLFTYQVSDGTVASSAVTVTLLDHERVPWHNATIPCDVNNDGWRTALDVINIINLLNELGPHSLASSRTPGALYYDVNFDGHVTAEDVVRVINMLNALNATSAEAEAENAIPSGGEVESSTLPVLPEPTNSPLPTGPAIDDLYYRGEDTRYQTEDTTSSRRLDTTDISDPKAAFSDSFWSWLGSLE